jgi:hypothetical protein
MHGCPPDEIQRIALHFIEDRGLHTTLKLNPTLLGPERVRALLQGLGWDLDVPDAVFAKDLSLDQALPIIRTLSAAARKRGVEFNLKLTNTLPCVNRSALPEAEQQVYCSGRPLHPLAVHVALLLREHLGEQQDSGPEQSEGCPPMSFCAGADAFNTPDLLAAGLGPVTTCSDLLKPGGYARLRQYLDVLKERMAAAGAETWRSGRPKAHGLAAYAQDHGHKPGAMPRRPRATRTSRSPAPCPAWTASPRPAWRPVPRDRTFRPTWATWRKQCPGRPDHHPGHKSPGAPPRLGLRRPVPQALHPGQPGYALAHPGGQGRRGPSGKSDCKDQTATEQTSFCRKHRLRVVVRGLDARSVSCAGTLIQAGLDVTLLVPENALQSSKTSISRPTRTADGYRGLACLEPTMPSLRDTDPDASPLIVLEGPGGPAQNFDHMFTFDAPCPPARQPAQGRSHGPRGRAGLFAIQGFASTARTPRPEADISALRLARHVRDFGPYAET